MVSVLLIFIYMFITTLVLGGVTIIALCKKESISLFHIEDLCVLGLLVVTVYAQTFSFFAKVGFVANVLLVCACAVLFFVFRRKVASFTVLFCNFRNIWKWIVGALVIIIMTYGASAGYMHYDSDLYHAQAIRWIEEYGVVKGLGNLHSRLAYNSSSFALTALYSFSWITGRSYHACAGFLASIVLLECLRGFPRLIKRNVKVSDFIRFGCIYYIFNIYDEMVSPESDYFAFLMLFFVAIRMVELAEDRVKDADAYAMFSLIAIFLVTVKLSVAMAVLVAIVPILFLVKEKRYKKLLVYVLLGIIIVAPYLCRGVLISGYLLYPSTMLDIFNVDWKMSATDAKVDSDFIIAYGRGYDVIDAAAYPFKVWILKWISTLGKTDMILLMTCLVGAIYYPISILLRKDLRKVHIIEGTLLVVFLSWFLSAPLIRYAQGILICFGSIMAGDAYSFICEKLKSSGRKVVIVEKLFSVIVSVFFSYKIVILLMYIINAGNLEEYAINQQDYSSYEMNPYEISGVTFYTSVEDDRTGYDPFPATPYINTNAKLRGDSLEEGFMSK